MSERKRNEKGRIVTSCFGSHRIGEDQCLRVMERMLEALFALMSDLYLKESSGRETYLRLGISTLQFICGENHFQG